MSNIRRVSEANKLHTKLLNAETLDDKIKLHEAAVNMIQDTSMTDDSARENQAPNDLMRERTNQNNQRFGHQRVQVIPLLTSNSRGGTLSSFDPSTEDGGSPSASNENIHQQRQNIPRRHSVSSNSSTSTSSSRIPKLTKAKYGSVTNIPPISGEHLAPDAERRVFNYNYRGPIPTQHHCQRSLFGKTVDVEPIETPKKKLSLSQSRIPLREQSRDKPITWSLPRYNIRPGMSLHEGSCTAARKLQSSKSDHNINQESRIQKETCERKTPTKKSSIGNLAQTSAKRRLDAWRPLERPNNINNFVEPLTSSTPIKQTQEDSDGYAIPSVSGSSIDQRHQRNNESPERREITPPDLYKTPAAYFNQRDMSDNDSYESAKEDQTPQKPTFKNRTKQQNDFTSINQQQQSRVISISQLHNDTVAEIAKIDVVLASVTPPCRKSKQAIPSRTINLTPRTDYSEIASQKNVEKSYKEIQYSIPAENNDKQRFEEMRVIHSATSTEYAVDKNPDSIQTKITPIKDKLNEEDKNSDSNNDVNVTPKYFKATLSTTKVTSPKIKENLKEEVKKSDFNNVVNITPKQSKLLPASIELTPGTKLKTSLTRETLIRNFKEALNLNIKSKKRYCKYEKEYLLKIGEPKKVDVIEAKIGKLNDVRKEAIKSVEVMTLEWTENIIRNVLRRIEELQNEAKRYLEKTNENKEKRRRQATNFGPLGVIDANAFEEEHLQNLSRRHENTLRLSQAVKNVEIKRSMVEAKEQKVIKQIVQLSMDKKQPFFAISSGSTSASTVSATILSRRSLSFTSNELRLLSEDPMNKRKIGNVVSKPEIEYVQQDNLEKNEDGGSRRSQSSNIIVSSRHSSRIIETQVTERMVVTENLIRIPQSANNIIPQLSATSSIVPRLDFSSLRGSATDEPPPQPLQKIEPIEAKANTKSTSLSSLVSHEIDPAPEVSKSSSSSDTSEPIKQPTERSDGRTSRDVSSISEFEPIPNEIVKTSDDERKTENDVSTMHDIEQSIHDDKTLTEIPSTHVEPKPIEHLHTPSEASIFSALPSSRTHLKSDEDELQSLPDPLSSSSSTKNEAPQKVEERKEVEVLVLSKTEEVQNADSDPERMPLSGTSGTLNASPISSSKLLGDSPIPSPPFIEPSASSVTLIIKELKSPTSEPPQQIQIILPQKSVEEEEISDEAPPEVIQSASSQSSSSLKTESSKVVIPSSLENSVHEQPKPTVNIVIEPDNDEEEKSSTTSSVTQSSTTTSIGTTQSSATTSVKSKSSSSSSADEDKTRKESPKSSSGETSVPEEIASTAKSSASSDLSSFLQSNNNTPRVASKPLEKDQPNQSTTIADDISETSFSLSGFSQSHDRSSSHRRKSWDMVETGVIGKRSPSYFKGNSIDDDISTILNNDPPKFEAAPAPLSPYAAVSPRSPRSSGGGQQHSKSHSLSRSPPHHSNKHFAFSNSSKSASVEAASGGESLLDDINFANIAAPIFDISGGSDRFSLGFKEQKNLLDWSPGLSKELSPTTKLAAVDKVRIIPKEELESYRSCEDTSISTQFEEPSLEKDVIETKNEIQNICKTLWPKIQKYSENGKLEENLKFRVKTDDGDNGLDQRFHNSFKKLTIDNIVFEAEKDIRKGIKYLSVEQFTKRITEICIKKLSLGCNNDLLDRRYIWIQRNPAFSNLVRPFQNEEMSTKEANEYKRNLVCTAIQCEKIINYSNIQITKLPDIAYDKTVKFLFKHAPEKLEAMLSQFSDNSV